MCVCVCVGFAEEPDYTLSESGVISGLALAWCLITGRPGLAPGDVDPSAHVTDNTVSVYLACFVYSALQADQLHSDTR